MGASTKNEPDRAGLNSEPRILVSAPRPCKLARRTTIAVDLAASEEQFAFTASTVGYCLPHPSPPNRGGVILSSDADRPERLLRPHDAHARHSRAGGAARRAA